MTKDKTRAGKNKDSSVHPDVRPGGPHSRLDDLIGRIRSENKALKALLKKLSGDMEQEEE